jgi:hypothetical protein
MRNGKKSGAVRKHLILLDCKHQGATGTNQAQPPDVQNVMLRNLQSVKVTTIVVTHWDRDHGSIRLPGDSSQPQPLAGNHDVDVVFYTDDVTLLHAAHHGTAEAKPPPAGESILRYVCPADRLEAVIGDLHEGFMKHMAQHGPSAARRWYWWQVARSLGMFCGKLLAAAAVAYEWLKKLGF